MKKFATLLLLTSSLSLSAFPAQIGYGFYAGDIVTLTGTQLDLPRDVGATLNIISHALILPNEDGKTGTIKDPCNYLQDQGNQHGHIKIDGKMVDAAHCEKITAATRLLKRQHPWTQGFCFAATTYLVYKHMQQ